jgi:predicted ArsR family transcriptional regulator
MDVRHRLKTGQSTTNGYLAELEDKGCLDRADPAPIGRGRPPKAWKPTGRDVDAEHVLPPVEEMFPEGAAQEMEKIAPGKPR